MSDTFGFQYIGGGTFRVTRARRSAITGRYVKRGEAMSANDKLAAALGPDTEAVRNELIRRRELAAMTKPELVTYALNLENNVFDLARSLEHAYGNEP